MLLGETSFAFNSFRRSIFWFPSNDHANLKIALMLFQFGFREESCWIVNMLRSNSKLKPAIEQPIVHRFRYLSEKYFHPCTKRYTNNEKYLPTGIFSMKNMPVAVVCTVLTALIYSICYIYKESRKSRHVNSKKDRKNVTLKKKIN